MIPNTIRTFFHCALCIAQKPAGFAPRDWAELEVGFTREGLQVWCRRHECNVIHIDFEGQKVGIVHEAEIQPQPSH